MNIPKQELEKEDVNMCEALVQLKEIGKTEGKVLAYLEVGKSDAWIIDHLQITQERLITLDSPARNIFSAITLITTMITVHASRSSVSRYIFAI
mgnify:CR=1 FL=1